jgi:Asp-tRNA(Asn)/Glu-tRNA(Gln) amidotransferase A subunit family amidase
MFPSRRFPTPWILSGFVLAVFSSGCSLLPKRAGGPPRDHTFITHFPSPADAATPAPGATPQIRLAVKDNIDMRGVVTTAGSEYVMKNSAPAAHDAACLAIVRQRPDVRIVGKTNLSEFAVAPSGINDYFGTPKNPFSTWRNLIPGGSSCGSASAVAKGHADIAFGTDTAGSIRVPAACCGVVGLKTTFGLVSLDGVFPIETAHLDTVGPLARDIAGTAQGMGLLQRGFAAKYNAAVARRPSGATIRIGRLKIRGTDRRIEAAVDEALKRAQFQVVPLDASFLAKWEQAKKDGTAVAAAGAWISDRKYVDKIGISPRTRSIILLGAVINTTQYRQALARRAEWQQTLREVFQQVDFIALPTMQKLPPKVPVSLKFNVLKAKAELANWQNAETLNLLRNPTAILTDPAAAITSIPLASLRLLGIDLLEAQMLNLQNTVAVNFAGNPALAVPIPVNMSGMPVTSLQLIGPSMSEADLLAAGRIVELTRGED